MRTYDETTRRVLARRDEALAAPKPQNIRVMRWAAAAACICVTASVGAFALHRMNSSSDIDSMIVYQQGDSGNALAPVQETTACESAPVTTTVSVRETITETTATIARSTAASTVTTTAEPQASHATVTSAAMTANTEKPSTQKTEKTVTGTTGQTTNSTKRTTICTTGQTTKRTTTNTLISKRTETKPVMTTTTTEIAREKPWGDKLLPERFPTMLHPMTGRNIYYQLINTTPLESRMIGALLCSANMDGFNEDTQQHYSVTAEFYRVKGYDANGSIETVLAIKFEGDDNYYPYRMDTDEFRYIPTLDKYLKIVNFAEYAEFGSIYPRDPSRELVGLSPEDIKAKVMELLFPDEEPLRSYACLDLENGMSPDAAIDIAIGLPDIGVPVGLSFKITEDGWVETNLFHIGKRFMVGEERTQEFIEWVYANTAEEPIVFIDGEEVPE